ncbi:hypothetical protein RI129_002720 [Pyrocoelia pectoralis]|uniref:DDE Tnp4 domain-containing protein n=1 Tax=Pyrocoelia pectoralis TaxID=417401 RepID=A0AAN7ZU12_9COLE
MIANRFQERTGFPGVVGAIDGCHVPIKAPAHNAIDYYNRKQFHSVVLQGVCDHKCLFIDIFVGMPGRVHDARAFRVSPLYDRIISENAPLIPDNFHLLGDSAYPIMKNVMVPYRDNGHLSHMQINFNTTLSTARSKIEQAFGRLKGKFRRLKYLDMNVDNVARVITAACTLHNYIIRREGMQNFHIDVDEIQENANQGEPRLELFDDHLQNIGTQKRNQIMEDIY